MGLLLGLLALAIRLANLAMLIYCVLSFVAPGNEIYRKASMYIEPILNPIRQKLYGWFPSLRNLPVDLSPLALWLLLDIAGEVVRILR